MTDSFCADEPGAPGRPEATDWDKDHVDLRWTPPLKDGGSPITGYVIEKREKGSPRWVKAGETGPDECKGRAENLDEGAEYEFRVRAINAAGPGEPSDASKSIVAKSRKGKFPKKIRIQERRTFIMDIPFSYSSTED